MTIPEVQDLKAELEDAMLQAFTDFQCLSGRAVVAVDLTHICYANLDIKPERYLTQVTVHLETI